MVYLTSFRVKLMKLIFDCSWPTKIAILYLALFNLVFWTFPEIYIAYLTSIILCMNFYKGTCHIEL